MENNKTKFKEVEKKIMEIKPDWDNIEEFRDLINSYQRAKKELTKRNPENYIIDQFIKKFEKFKNQ